MDIQEVLHDREVFLIALWYFEGNADLPVVIMQRIRYRNSRSEYLERRRRERTAAALAAAEAEVARLRAANFKQAQVIEKCDSRLNAVLSQLKVISGIIDGHAANPHSYAPLTLSDIAVTVRLAYRALGIEEATHENG